MRTFCFISQCNTAGTEDILDVFNCSIFLAWNVVSLATRYYENLVSEKFPHTEFKGQKYSVLLLAYIYRNPWKREWKKPHSHHIFLHKKTDYTQSLLGRWLSNAGLLSFQRQRLHNILSLFQSSLCSWIVFCHLGLSCNAYNLSLLQTEQFVLFITFYIFKECYHPLQPLLLQSKHSKFFQHIFSIDHTF